MAEPIAIPALDTNYFWLLPTGKDSGRAYLVDPGDAHPVMAALEQYGLSLAGILVTHHHWDHTDGLDDLLARYPVPVYGPDSVRQVNHPLKEGDQLRLEGWQFDIIAVPGHTLDHLAYMSREQTPPRLFCGDVLFAGGCGRLFEGSPEIALKSLHKLSQLPGDTLVYCAHEYTLTNLRFAREVDPDNATLRERLPTEEAKRSRGEPTLPTQIQLERASNPFLRASDPGIQNTLRRIDPEHPVITELESFTRLRLMRDRFR